MVFALSSGIDLCIARHSSSCCITSIPNRKINRKIRGKTVWKVKVQPVSAVEHGQKKFGISCKRLKIKGANKIGFWNRVKLRQQQKQNNKELYPSVFSVCLFVCVCVCVGDGLRSSLQNCVGNSCFNIIKKWNVRMEYNFGQMLQETTLNDAQLPKIK